MQDWWKSLTPKQQMALIVAIIGAIGGFSVALSITIDTGKNTTTTITNNGDQLTGTGDIIKGDKIIQGDNVAGNKIINIGLTLEEHEQRLKSREAEIRAELNRSHTDDRHLLEIELKAIETALQDSKASYEALVSSLKDRIAQLEAQRGDWLDDVLDKAIEALQKGDVKTADSLFQQVEQDSEKHIKRAAEAAYQRGKIAEDQIRYADSLKHYENAVRLQAENTLYLNDAGLMHKKLANYKRAIEYYELALASDLKNYGESHPDVAIDRNNLGNAWKSLGKYDKAIEYYEQALDQLEKSLGKDHPNTKTVRDNLDTGRIEAAKYQ